jgi:hypothetical protein
VPDVVDGRLVDAEVENGVGRQGSLPIIAYGGVKPPGVSKGARARFLI